MGDYPAARLKNGYYGHGELGERTPTGRCSACGFANFVYNNGHEWSACGVRGYRCVNCGTIKPEIRHAE